MSHNVKITYVNCFLSTFHTPLWISLVDNSVEIVEKFRFSTILPGFYTSVDRLHFSTFFEILFITCGEVRIMSPGCKWIILAKIRKKVDIISNRHFFWQVSAPCCATIFVNFTQMCLPYDFLTSGDTVTIMCKQEEPHAG